MQTDDTPTETFGGIPFRAGATVIFDSEGNVRYIASKPMVDANLPARPSTARRCGSIQDPPSCASRQLDCRDPTMPFADEKYLAQRMKLRAQFRALHEGLGHG